MLTEHLVQYICDHHLGVAYDSLRDIFYWAIAGSSTILRQLDSGFTVPLPLSSVTDATSVAVDYIGQRLYWIERNGVRILYVLCM